jgi:hypothetical protein
MNRTMDALPQIFPLNGVWFAPDPETPPGAAGFFLLLSGLSNP